MWYTIGMSIYEHFSEVYDLFMDNVSYDEWAEYLIRRLRAEGIEDGLICELGCGTGNMTVSLRDAGYDMIGVDSSGPMLAEAFKKELYRKHPELADRDLPPAETGPGRDILYLQQDMRAFELYGTVRAFISVCDSLNYILEEEELLQVFRLVNNYLDPGGIFLFDMNTAARYEQIGESTIAENREQGSFIWENSYDPVTQRNRYDLTLFVREDRLYRKYEEVHLERAYSPDTLVALIERAGMECLEISEAYTDAPVTEDTERILIVARECLKGPDGKSVPL